MFDYEDLDTSMALAPGGPVIHPEAPDNVAYDWATGDKAATEAAFASAAHTTRLEVADNRIIANAMETRGCYAEMTEGRLHMAYSGQGVWGLKGSLASTLGLGKEDVHVTTPDVGGGFGMKAFDYPEYFMVGHATQVLGKPVRWQAERTESMLSDNSGRDLQSVVELAFDAELKITAYRVDTISNMGAYNSGFAQFIQSDLASRVLAGVYDIQTAWFRNAGIYTNTTQVDAYRGAGRPEAIYKLERAMDHAARQLGVDPLELRRRNFVGKDQFPYTTVTMGDPDETAKVEFTGQGTARLYVGTQSNGQGHETVYRQLLNEFTGIPLDKVEIVQGDSDRIKKGGGTGGSRSVTTQGTAIRGTAEAIIDRFKPFVADQLGVPEVAFEEGTFRAEGSNTVMTLIEAADAASEAGQTDLLTTSQTTTLPGRSFPNGCHVAEVEIDPETGQTRVAKFTVVDDFGVLMNPMLAEGQVHGGVVQGIGQAISEHVVYDDDGQLLTASFMDYGMPRARCWTRFGTTACAMWTCRSPRTGSGAGCKIRNAPLGWFGHILAEDAV